MIRRSRARREDVRALRTLREEVKVLTLAFLGEIDEIELRVARAALLQGRQEEDAEEK